MIDPELIRILNKEKNELIDKLIECEFTMARLQEVEVAARIIFDVSNKAFSRANPVKCPHGHVPSYPAHAWWCDDCFWRLEAALANVQDE